MKKIFRFFCLILCICLCGAGFHVKKYNGKAEISAGKAECVIECNSGRILYESHGDLRLPMASTTKILTAITVLEMAEDLQENVVIPPEAVGIEGLYPCAEGAGYAGGIMSAAADGIRCAEKVLEKLMK